ncbi:hypothetical protein WJX84_001572 [Apatococcus fuscideae]|uniref:Amine oxidase domain-containing protein n=1 Tax=Apatococcus fuscideae TaxID=2026836 RepID=A0AAW1TKY8_9CHLO
MVSESRARCSQANHGCPPCSANLCTPSLCSGLSRLLTGQLCAKELFQRYGVSQRLYDEFLKPLLLVGLFAPPEQISAASMLETFYFYTLAHQADFDVCWCKGSVSELIFKPLVDLIQGLGGRIQGGRLASDLDVNPETGRVQGVIARSRDGSETTYPADAVIFAVGITGMQKLIGASPTLAARPEFRRIMTLQGLDVMATRLWFDRRVETRFPSNVLSGFEETTGGTFFNLNQLQDEYKDVAEGVIAADFYHSNELMALSDEEIVQKVHDTLKICEPGFRDAKVVDSAVLRFSKAVTHFNPGSLQGRPRQWTSFGNVFMAGDWVKDVNHGAKGLSQERAFVTGLTAANLVVKHLGCGEPAKLLDTEPDEPHIALGKELNKRLQSTLSLFGANSLGL